MPTAPVNGAEIYYEEVGSGTPLILSPGGLDGVLNHFRPVMEGLSQGHRVIAYDRRFGGQSSSPVVVQTWDLVCQDVLGLMDFLGIDQAHLGGGSFGAAISMRCAALHPKRVRAIFPSNIAGGIVCNSFLTMKLFQSADLAINLGMKSLVPSLDQGARFPRFVPERAKYDSEYRETLEAMEPADFAQIMRDTILALFDGPYSTLGMAEEMLQGIRKPTLLMPGNNDIHPRWVAEQVHRLIPNCQWADIPPHFEAPDQYVRRVLKFLAEVEAGDG